MATQRHPPEFVFRDCPTVSPLFVDVSLLSPSIGEVLNISRNPNMTNYINCFF